MHKPSVHLDNIQSKIKERHAELLAMDKVIYHKSTKVNYFLSKFLINYNLYVCLQDLCTYAFYNSDPRMTLVIAYENGKQKDKETHITSFMTDLCMHIRCNKIYECLKLSK